MQISSCWGGHTGPGEGTDLAIAQLGLIHIRKGQGGGSMVLERKLGGPPCPALTASFAFMDGVECQG